MVHQELMAAVRSAVFALDPRQLHPDTTLAALNFASMIGFALLIFMPRGRLTQLYTKFVPILAGIFYALAFAIIQIEGRVQFDFMTVRGLQRSFQDDLVMLLGWAHYICFDLFVGRWMVQDSQENELHHLLIIIPLALTMLAGPMGFISYLAIRVVFRSSSRGKKMKNL